MVGPKVGGRDGAGAGAGAGAGVWTEENAGEIAGFVSFTDEVQVGPV